MQELKIAVSTCPHVSADKANGRDSITEAANDLLANYSDAAVWMILGDFSAEQGFMTQAEAQEIASQLAPLRNKTAVIMGNHDRPAPWDLSDNLLARQYIDPVGEYPTTSGFDVAQFPFQMQGTWKRYKFQVGNMRFLMLSDVNRPTTGRRGAKGGDPGGVILPADYAWLIYELEDCKAQGHIAIIGAHYMLEGTTACTTHGSNNTPGHGPSLVPGASPYLAYLGDQHFPYLIRDWMITNPGVVGAYFGGHNHLPPGHTDEHGRKTKWEDLATGCMFWNCANLTAHHGPNSNLYPRTRVFTFTDGSASYQQRTFFHMNKGNVSRGWANGGTNHTLPSGTVSLPA